MDFDHRDGEEKAMIVGKLNLGATQRLLDEMAKCDVGCASSRRIRTWRRMQGLPA